MINKLRFCNSESLDLNQKSSFAKGSNSVLQPLRIQLDG